MVVQDGDLAAAGLDFAVGLLAFFAAAVVFVAAAMATSALSRDSHRVLPGSCSQNSACVVFARPLTWRLPEVVHGCRLRPHCGTAGRLCLTRRGLLAMCFTTPRGIFYCFRHNCCCNALRGLRLGVDTRDTFWRASSCTRFRRSGLVLTVNVHVVVVGIVNDCLSLAIYVFGLFGRRNFRFTAGFLAVLAGVDFTIVQLLAVVGLFRLAFAEHLLLVLSLVPCRRDRLPSQERRPASLGHESDVRSLHFTVLRRIRDRISKTQAVAPFSGGRMGNLSEEVLKFIFPCEENGDEERQAPTRSSFPAAHFQKLVNLS
ncbi:hypothetical protein MTO96_006317 [Rhipicephalus appendiculatus]